MNVHSVGDGMPVTARRLSVVKQASPTGDKRDAILRAATKVFAQNGFFQSQVADVARVAGVAAGTVYLYFSSKDDLLVSIFERTMREAIAEGRTALEGVADPRERLRRIAQLHLERLGRDRDLAVVFQVELRQSMKFMERFSVDLPAGLLQADPRDDRRRAAERRVPQRHQRDDGRQDLFRRARRDGHQLDAEPAQVRPRRLKPTPSSTCSSTGSAAGDDSSPAAHDSINSVAVLGAGTMGAQIALHCANAGIPVAAARPHARAGARRASRRPASSSRIRSSRPTPTLVTTGGFDTHMDLHRQDCDWIMEAVVERLDIKQQLLARVDEKRRPGSIVSSNTSGIPIAALAEGRSDDFRRHWLGTHFFNPPRYLRLLEIIPTRGDRSGRRRGHHASSAITCSARAWSSRRTRRTSSATTSPSTAWRARSRRWRAGSYTIEEIDAITGPALGRPGSATFRTMDIAGVDVLAHVMRNLNERLPDERRPRRVRRAAVRRRRCSSAAGSARRPARASTNGARTRPARPRSGRSISTTLEYRPKQSARIASIEAGKIDRRPAASACACCSTPRTRPASSCARRWRRRWSTPRA